MTGQGHLANIGKVSYAARFTLFDGPASEILSLEPQQIERVENDWRSHEGFPIVRRS